MLKSQRKEIKIYSAIFIEKNLSKLTCALQTHVVQRSNYNISSTVHLFHRSFASKLVLLSRLHKRHRTGIEKR